MSEQEAGLIAAAELGEQVTAFLATDLGRVLVGMAEQEVQLAQEALMDVDPLKTNEIMHLQMKAQMGRNFKAWLTELVTDGNNAISVYSQRDSKGD